MGGVLRDILIVCADNCPKSRLCIFVCYFPFHLHPRMHVANGLLPGQLLPLILSSPHARGNQHLSLFLHPRIHGANPPDLPDLRSLFLSSPYARGKPCWQHRGGPLFLSSPYARGKHTHVIAMNVAIPFIPVCTGQTPRPARRRTSVPFHPRMHGANDDPLVVAESTLPFIPACTGQTGFCGQFYFSPFKLFVQSYISGNCMSGHLFLRVVGLMVHGSGKNRFVE